MSHREAAKGPRFALHYACDAQGRYPAEEFLASLLPHQARDHAGMLALFQRFADHGPIHNPEQFKPLAKTDPPLVEFKKGQARVFAFYNGAGVLVLLDGVIKKKDKLDPIDIARAQRIRAEHINHQAAGR
jgi:hypothetical protein